MGLGEGVGEGAGEGAGEGDGDGNEGVGAGDGVGDGAGEGAGAGIDVVGDGGGVDLDEAQKIRVEWEELKRVAEQFVLQAEAGRYMLDQNANGIDPA